jgi:hypothetical protein
VSKWRGVTTTKAVGRRGKGYVAFSGDLNEVGALKNQLGINQGSKSRNKREGGCRARKGEALNSAFGGYYTKNGIWQELGSKRGFTQNKPKAKTGSSGEPVLRDTLNVAVNEGG